MEKNKDLFIKTKDEETRNILMREGFEMIDYSAGVWTFLNCPMKYNENKIDSDKIIMSNILNV